MQKEIFQKNRESLVLLPEIVSLLKKQMFFEGSKLVRVLIQNIGIISDYIVKSEMLEDDKNEWLLILQAFLNAQENKDYILMADILEDDMLIFLEKLQCGLLAEGYADVSDYWEANMQSLKQADSVLFKTISQDCEDVSKQSVRLQYEPMIAVNGQPTLKVHMDGKTFCMHSTVNPQWEAQGLASLWLERGKSEYLIFGMGMGYHVKALLEKDENIRVTVLEYRIESLQMALQYLDFEEYIADGRLVIAYASDIMQVLHKMKEKEGEYALFIHNPSLQCVEQKEIKEILEDYFINTSSMIEQGKSLDQNFEYLQKQNLPECSTLREVFEGKKVAIVAGGPSVDDEIESLKKYREDVVILSVGTVTKKLLGAGIRPDAFIITDPQNTMYRQVEGIMEEKIPLLLLSTASKTILDYYQGPIYLVYQHGYEPAERVAKEQGYSLFQTGGSVTTTALDVSIEFGAEEIILIGADMAYTNNRSHSNGMGHEENDFSDFREVVSVGGGTVYTTRNLDIYRKWIERRISDLKTPVVYNTSRGARIAGTIEDKLENILK